MPPGKYDYGPGAAVDHVNWSPVRRDNRRDVADDNCGATKPACDTFVLHFDIVRRRWLTVTIMSTTTIRIPDDLKDKITRAAERTGKSPHSFILEAITEKAELEERRADFAEGAEKRYDAIVASGKTIPWAQMRQYLNLRAAGKRAARPKARRLAR